MGSKNKPMNTRLTIKKVNAAIAHTGLQLTSGQGYFYWLDLKGVVAQDAPSVWVARLNHFSLARWIAEAESAAEIR
jgi:hypothetical protein